MVMIITTTIMMMMMMTENRLGVVKLSQSFQISCKRLAWLDALKSTSIIQTSVDFMC